ncbi:12402_t:CDS:2 [Ambispora gerdemannii]|uniref:12402_t:CDS:1 n=1 Tax=Ambispora gerdemannii TaxID=144530 RepID=A0A9N9EWA7_9GLOM|nr:12402_t:CDS:2 [Ambispora gerdemannii]
MSENNSENQRNQQRDLNVIPPTIVTTNTDGIGGFIVSSPTSTNDNDTLPSPPSVISSPPLALKIEIEPYRIQEPPVNHIHEMRNHNNNSQNATITTLPSMPSSSMDNFESPPPYEATLNTQSHSNQNQSTEEQMHNAEIQLPQPA